MDRGVGGSTKARCRIKICRKKNATARNIIYSRRPGYFLLKVECHGPRPVYQHCISNNRNGIVDRPPISRAPFFYAMPPLPPDPSRARQRCVGQLLGVWPGGAGPLGAGAVCRCKDLVGHHLVLCPCERNRAQPLYQQCQQRSRVRPSAPVTLRRSRLGLHLRPAQEYSS